MSNTSLHSPSTSTFPVKRSDFESFDQLKSNIVNGSIQLSLPKSIRRKILNLNKGDLKSKCHKRRLGSKALRAVSSNHQKRLISTMNMLATTSVRQTGKTYTGRLLFSRAMFEIKYPTKPKWTKVPR